MSATVSALVSSLKCSGIRAIMDLALGMDDVLRLEVGEPHFPTPPHIVEAACRAARDGYTKYTANAGLPSLRRAIVDRIERDYGVVRAPENVVVTVGGLGAISTCLRTVADIGDEVLIPDPGWPNYEMIVLAIGAVPRRYRLDPANACLPSPRDLEGLLTSRTRAVVVNSPSNPLGTVFPRALVEELVKFAGERGLFLISDEVYDRIVYEGEHTSALSFDTGGNVISVFSLSKTYAMTGWRVGYAIADKSVAVEMCKIQEAYVACAPSVSQKAAEAAIEGPQDSVKVMREAYRENTRVAMEILDRHGVGYQAPRGAFYLWIDVGREDSAEFAKGLLLREHVSVAPGGTFGPSGERRVRVSLASPRESIREGLTRMTRFLGK